MCNPASPSSLCTFNPLDPTKSKVCGITLVALGALMLAVTAIIIYSLATAPSEVWCEFHQVVHEVSAKPYIILPILFLGLPGIGIMFCGFNKMNCFSCASQENPLPHVNTPLYPQEEDTTLWSSSYTPAATSYTQW